VIDDLIAWLKAQLDEDERLARTADDEVVDWVGSDTDEHGEPAAGQHIRRHLPTRVLADVAAKRAVLDEHAVLDNGTGKLDSRYCRRCFAIEGYNADVLDSGEGLPVWCLTVRLLAQAYADRPGYREEWRP
jgi:hypothetical protein